MGITHFDQAPGRTFELGHLRGRWTFLGEAAGSIGVGVRRIEVPAGGWSTPAHDHGREEEIFYVLAGRGIVWHGGATAPVSAGDCIVFHPRRGGHSFHSLEALDLLAFGQREYDESPRFPRLGISFVGNRAVETVPASVDGVPLQFVRESELGPPALEGEPGPRGPHLVNLSDVEPRTQQRPRIDRTRRNLGAAVGSIATGLQHVVVTPGKLSAPLHCHSLEEELFVILEGDGVLLLDDRETSVLPGHVVSRTNATGVSHAFRAGSRGLTFLAYGTREPGDICYYPTSNKLNFGGVGVIARLQKLDYWDGEDWGRAGRRAFVVVLDACGVGALPDAGDYGDAGTNTLTHLASAAGGLSLPVLERLGLGSIVALQGVSPAAQPVLHGRLAAIGPGKDSTAGHWGLMGVACAKPLVTYPDGFPPAVLDVVRRAAGRPVICNRPYNGIDVIDDFGEEQMRTGSLIVYTSQDSVLQIAAHDQVVGTQDLYEICAHVRAWLPAEHAVGRVIARPFTGEPGHFERTDGRRDLSLPPPSRSYLNELQDAGVPVHSVGKVGQLFAGAGIDVQHPGASNASAMALTTELLGTLRAGLVFTNLVETDQVYGHRHDVEGFTRALVEIDAQVGRWLELIGAGDMLILTADHGCDVTAEHTDHTREYVPLLAVFEGHGSRRHDGSLADVGASALMWLTGRGCQSLPGESFVL